LTTSHHSVFADSDTFNHFTHLQPYHEAAAEPRQT